MAMAEAANSGAAMVPPQYGATEDKCPRCGHSLGADGECPECGYKSPVVKALHWDVDFEQKGAEWSVKELGNGTLVIEGYASTWDKDRDGDEIMKSAFDESLPNYLRDNPVLLKDHDREKVMGLVTRAQTDNVGLKIRAEVPKPEPGEESWKFTVYNDIKRGLRRALSIGGVFERGKSAFKTIYKVNLYEISNIAVPSNPKSLFRVVDEKGVAPWETKASPAEGEAKAEMSSAAINDLPDSDFAYIEDGGEKDDEGKTTPRSKRHFPIHDAAHVRDALARAPQSPFGDKALPKIKAAAEKLGIHVAKSATFTAQEAEIIMTEDTKGAGEGKVVLDAKEFAELSKRLADWDEKEAKARIEAEAEAQAKSALEAEEKAAKAAAEKKAAEAKSIAEIVEAKLAAARAQGGRKFPVAVETGTKAEKGESMVHLLYRKAQGDSEAREKLVEMSMKAAEEYGIKALGEGAGSAGFLVPPVYWQQGIAEFRLAAAKVRQLCTVIPGIATNLVYMPRETGIASVGWTAENATKVSTDQTFGQIAVNIFTLAGISKVSRQLLEDSSPAVDMIVRKDLGRLLGQAEDIAFLSGNGAGQPSGILNTSNVLGGDLGSQTVADAIAAAITAIQANYFGDPEAILIHPIHLNLLRTAKDLMGRYIFEPTFFAQADPRNRAFGDNANGLGGGYSNMPSQGGPQGTVWGLPVYADANLDSTPGAGNMIVGAFSECYVLERSGVTLDVSSEAGTSFEQNQTWFRGEERLGFTAARQPHALYVVSSMP
jgi:HK97 family phage major capsid protein/HK97 family phage prohead protease